MHHKTSELQIRQESKGVSSDFNPTPPLFHLCSQQKHFQIFTQYHSQFEPQTNPYFLKQTQFQTVSHRSASPSPLSKTYTNRLQSQFQEQPISNVPSISHPFFSEPYKRSTMIQSPSSLSHSPTLSSFNHYHNSCLNTKSTSSSSSSTKPHGLCSAPFAIIPCVIKSLALKFVRQLRCARLLRVHFRFLILFCLPSLYFFVSNHRRSIILDLLSLLAFSAALLISLNLARTQLVSIRLFLTRLLPSKLFSSCCTSKSPSQPVVWSIGSKPKTEKRPNSGPWVQVYGNNDVYEGEFHKGKFSGSGVFYYHMSGRYEGDWIDEKYDGYGVETWAKGSRYRGQYRQGLRDGIGVYRFFTGDVFAGEWSYGQCHGCGVHTCADGSQYVGEFKWGVKHGLGHYHFRNGDMYAGEYFADKMHGFGVYQFANGHRYEGAWHEGRREGFGMYTFRNGETQSGHWQNGVLDARIAQNSQSGSPCTIDNSSKVVNAVQEARRAAERAHKVPKMEERVNKVIAAANKAANAARVAAVKAVQMQMHWSNSDDTSIQV